MTGKGFLRVKKLAAGFTRHWWMAFALVVALPSLGLSVVSLRLIDRLAHDELADLLRASEATPWYYEEKMNRALEARALHAARVVGYGALGDPQKTREKLVASGLDLFEEITVDRDAPAHAPPVASGALMGTTDENALPLEDAKGDRIGTLRYRYSRNGLRAVLRECLDERRALWNDDAVEIFLGGPVDGHFHQGFDLHLAVRVDDPVLYERQGRTRDVRYASRRTPDGFNVEVAIPWRHVGVDPVAGAALRFDLTDDDNDLGGPVRDGQKTWAGYDRNWADPSGLGVLKLARGRIALESSREAAAFPAGSVEVDGRLSEPEWALDYEAAKAEGVTDNVVHWGALWNADALYIGVHVRDAKVVNNWSREDVPWVLRITDPQGEALLDSSPDAGQVFGQPGGVDVKQMIGLGPLKASQILFAFRDRPVTRRIERWKVGVVGLIAAMDVLLGFGLWLVFTNVKREMDLAALKNHFVATVSHEFKAPLALLQASAETLRGGRVLDDEKRRRYEEIIEAESRRLASLVENVLSVSRIEAGRHYHFARTDVAAVVDAALSLHRLKLERQGFDVRVTVPRDLPPVTADAGALQEALSNLIDNAVKYSRERKECRIEARAVDGRVEISVSDSGLGVPSSDREKIFERFYRGEREGHGEKGVGLGLSIARDIAAAHGGDVRLENGSGGGSTFTLVLPVKGQGA